MIVQLLSTKVVILAIAGVALVGGLGYTLTRSNSSSSSGSSAAEVKLAGPQATGQNLEVNDASLSVNQAGFSNDANIVNPGYVGDVSIRLYSSKKLSRVAVEEIKVDNLEAIGDCATSEKDGSTSSYLAGSVVQMGFASFKLTCHTGVTYNTRDVLNSTGEFDGAKLLSYGGLTPAALTRSLSFAVAVKFDDGTLTKKTFTGQISGATLFKGDFGAGTLSGKGEKF